MPWICTNVSLVVPAQCSRELEDEEQEDQEHTARRGWTWTVRVDTHITLLERGHDWRVGTTEGKGRHEGRAARTGRR